MYKKYFTFGKYYRYQYSHHTSFEEIIIIRMSLNQITAPSDWNLIKAFQAFQKILDLTHQQVVNILGDEPSLPLTQNVKKRIRMILRIVYLQDIWWNYASYPQVRPSFTTWLKTWFHSSQSELENYTPLQVILKDNEDGIKRVLNYAESLFYEDDSEDFSWTYQSIRDGSIKQYP